MALRTTEVEWTEIFKAAGIPDESSVRYAKVFVENGLSRNDLADLDKPTLTELTITTLGDQFAILRLGKNEGNVTDTKPSYKNPSASASIKLPSVTSEMTHPQFRKFLVDWKVYRMITALPAGELTVHLYSACAPDVQNSVINTIPDFLEKDEASALDALEQLVTKRINPTVHRMGFTSIRQGDQETVKDFLVRLKSSSIECQFECPKCKEDLSTVNIRDQFIRGILNNILQTEILAQASQLDTLEKIVKHAEAFEAAVRDQSSLDTTMNEMARISDYKRSKQQHTSAQADNKQKSDDSRYRKNKACSGCGSLSHGYAGSNNRDTKCPAWGKVCSNCSVANHFSKVCRREAAAHIKLIAHLNYDDQHDTFTVASNASIDEISALLTPEINSGETKKSVSMKIFPDSGASICIAGAQHLNQLGASETDLIPCNKKIAAVGGSLISCIGCIRVKFDIEGYTTCQPVYICDKVDKIYFSKQGCIDTNIIPPSFPFPMPNSQSLSVAAVEFVKRTPPPLKPATMPFPPLPENVPKLEEYIKNKFASSAFNRSPPFPIMDAPPAHIHLKANAIPHARHTPIPIPHHWREAVKKGLDEDVEREVICPVPIGAPVEWCSSMVVIPKGLDKIRRCIDLQQLNLQCMRETHHCSSPFQLASQVPPMTWKTVLDAVDGFHAIKLDEESQPLTTFITEWGRFMYLRMPQGFIAAGDAYTRRYDEIIQHIPNKVKIIDDTLLYSEDIENAFYHTWEYLTLCATKGVVVNDSKLQFCRREVDFAGLTVTEEGVAPSRHMLSAIENFPTPTDLTGARSWFGIVNQVSWAYSIGPLMQPFRDLIKPKTRFFWDATLQTLFDNSKHEIIELVKKGVAAYNIDLRTCIQPDWCKLGIGYLLLQQHCNCKTDVPTCCPTGWKLVFANSRFTTPGEHNYSPTEGEALALSWSLESSRIYTLGCTNLLASVDHKPLLGIFNDRELSTIQNPRLQSLKQDTFPWHFQISYNPGKWHRGPDALSRNPAQVEAVIILSELEGNPLLQLLCEDGTHCDQEAAHTRNEQVRSVTVEALIDLSNSAITLEKVETAAQHDDIYRKLLATIRAGFPNSRHATDPQLRDYWQVRHRLSCLSNIALLDKRIVIPQSLRKQILETLHSAHQGVCGMKARAAQCVYWPGMDASIRNYRSMCTAPTCTTHGPSNQAEPIVLTPLPEWPFQKICMDYFFIDIHSYLVVVDRFSGWICIFYFRPGESTSSALIKECRELFISYGVPEEVSSDGGPQFKANDFSKFLQQWGVKHRKSSVGYPQSNGRAEVAVKSAKRIIRDNVAANGSIDTDEAAKAILQYHNTPLVDDKLSPAQILFHRQLRDVMPNHPSHYQLHAEWLEAAQRREDATQLRNQTIAERYNEKTRNLIPLTIGTKVFVQGLDKKWRKHGVVVDVLQNRQYRIRLDGSGRVTLQNRRFLQKSTTTLLPKATVHVGAPPDAEHDNPALKTTEADENTQYTSQECSASSEEPMNQHASHQVAPPSEHQQVPQGVTASPQVPGTGGDLHTRRMPRELRNLQDYNRPGPRW